MFAQFTVGNFRSIKEPISLSLTATKLKSRYQEINDNNVFTASKNIDLVKSAVIYGANASGKSNLIQALSFMRHFVINSSRESLASDPIEVEPFALGDQWENKPSFFEIMFFLNGKLYRYGFEADEHKIYNEWLFQTVRRESKIFIRESGKSKIDMTDSFRRTEGRNLDELTRPNALFLSVLAQWNSTLAQTILEWFKQIGIISGIYDIGYKQFTLEQFQKDKLIQQDIINFMQEMDLDIRDIVATETDIAEMKLPSKMPEELQSFLMKNGSTLTTIAIFHERFDDEGESIGHVEFDLDDHESAGTQKMFALSGPLFHTLRNGEVLVIDELDARLHPLITKSIIQLFNSNKTNPKNAQLIFATHDTNHLSNRLFRRDQIWFMEKDKFAATDLYSLSDFKIRNDASYEADYIAGKYGAIPFVGASQNLIHFDDEVVAHEVMRS
ncbi:abortive infection protein, putative [hydrothermal vent metagenome]|uniref:Abortive infection protein, putative n=1 Tax=hydrothermal vent metagenome TaxID=652676 RepID=A0A3B0WGI3_9ZZZZ